jgi:hypothetical protein
MLTKMAETHTTFLSNHEYSKMKLYSYLHDDKFLQNFLKLLHFKDAQQILYFNTLRILCMDMNNVYQETTKCT